MRLGGQVGALAAQPILEVWAEPLSWRSVESDTGGMGQRVRGKFGLGRLGFGVGLETQPLPGLLATVNPRVEHQRIRLATFHNGPRHGESPPAQRSWGEGSSECRTFLG